MKSVDAIGKHLARIEGQLERMREANVRQHQALYQSRKLCRVLAYLVRESGLSPRRAKELRAEYEAQRKQEKQL